MIRQQRRRIERQWNKLKVGKICTNFIERNGLYNIPQVIAFQAIKVWEDLLCVYNVDIFDSKKDGGHCEYVMTCMFVNSLFRSLGSVQIAFIPEDDLWDNMELNY